MTIDKSFDPAISTARWAQQAARDLEMEAEKFFTADKVEAVTDVDTATGETVLKLKFVPEVPDAFARRATEAITNAKHSFDQSIYAAHAVLTKGASARSIYYPWSTGPADLDGLLVRRGIDDRLHDVLRAQRPYFEGPGHEGGDNIVRTLAQIANDKHTAGLSVYGNIERLQFPRLIIANVQSFKMMKAVWDLKTGEAELARYIGDAQIGADWSVRLSIYLTGDRLPTGVDAFTAIARFTDRAAKVADELKSHCRTILKT